MLVLMLGVGIYLTVGLKAMTWRKIPRAFRGLWIGKRPEDESKITGVVTAIVLGGPGAVFWIWMTALVAMATQYGQAALSPIILRITRKYFGWQSI